MKTIFTRMAINVEISSATSVGKIRAANEDSFFVSEIGEHDALLAIVADGMGGHNAGEIASAEAVKTLKANISLSCDSPKDELEIAIQCANNSIYNMSKNTPTLHGMGTTVTACVVLNNKVTAAHVGDSRLYLIRGGEITQITKDHSLVEMLLQSGSITKEDAKHHPQKNVITRALGTNNSVETDFYEFEVLDGDVIMLCSDGLVNMLDDGVILSMITECRDFSAVANDLVTAAENAGGDDNITVILIKL